MPIHVDFPNEIWTLLFAHLNVKLLTLLISPLNKTFNSMITAYLNLHYKKQLKSNDMHVYLTMRESQVFKSSTNLSYFSLLKQESILFNHASYGYTLQFKRFQAGKLQFNVEFNESCTIIGKEGNLELSFDEIKPELPNIRMGALMDFEVILSRFKAMKGKGSKGIEKLENSYVEIDNISLDISTSSFSLQFEEYPLRLVLVEIPLHSFKDFNKLLN